MPAVCAVDLREALLARVRAATAGAALRQDAELAAEMEALEAAGGLAAPGAGGGCETPGPDSGFPDPGFEVPGPGCEVPDPGCEVPDPDCGPPDGADAWLADLPAELLAEYVAATDEPPGREAIVAGRLPRQDGDGCGFAAGGAADDLPPGAALAGLAGGAWAGGWGRLCDDELIGVLRAARRLASWSAAMELAAVAELTARRIADAEAAGDFAPGEHIGDEIAAALTLTGRAAGTLLDLALALRRLPATMDALATGRIDRYKAAVIADEVTGLGDEHAAAVEQQVLLDAPAQTTGQLRTATRQAVLTADPAAAHRRKQRAQRDARVEKWDEHAGTAALAGRDLPSAGVLAADQNLSALARSLKQSGASGTMDQLRAQVYLALLTGQSIGALLPPGGSGPGPAGPGTGLCVHGPSGSVNLTMPLATWLGLSGTPGHAAGYGPLDAGDSRGLAALLAGEPATRWCITLTGEHGKPVAHGCARAGPGPAGGARPPPPSAPGLPSVAPGWLAGALSWLAGIALTKLETGECSHQRESPAYRPPPSLRHLITIRQPTCCFPGCRRPATHCDQDHTIPYDQGGKTCECNLAPLCRRHHHTKQAHGWTLAQPEPGTMTWTSPNGRAYTTGPATYPG